MILVCGEALIDLFVGPPAPGSPAELSARAIAGGSPFNVAVGLARLGAPAGYLGGIGPDVFGDLLRARLQAEGVDVALTKRSAAPTPLVVVSTGPDGVPAYTVHDTGCADRDLLPADIPDALPDRVVAIAMGSWPLVVEPVGSTLLALAEREAGRRVISLDPNLRPSLIGDLGAWRQRFARFAATASIIKLSAEDLHTAWPGMDAASLAASWLAGGTALVVLTDGPYGATAFHASGRLHVPGRSVTVQDTVGAGDSFHAALLAGLHDSGRLTRAAIAALDSPALQALIDKAVLASSITCTRRGADLPSRTDLAQAMAACS